MRWSERIVVCVAGLLLMVGVGCSDSDENGGSRDTGVQMDTSMDVPDGEPTCEPVAIPCCNDSGEQVTYAQCTFDGLKCPSGLTEMNCYDGGMTMDTGEEADTGVEDGGATEDASGG
jgi:hypothetical protein